MAVDISALTDYTWAQIKLAAKSAMVNAAVGGSTLSINGRTIGRISITEAKKLYDMATEMEAAEASTETSGTAVVVFGNPQ